MSADLWQIDENDECEGLTLERDVEDEEVKEKLNKIKDPTAEEPKTVAVFVCEMFKTLTGHKVWLLFLLGPS